MNKFNLFIPITKIDVAKREVYGIATAEQVDKSGEIMDYETTKPFYKDWSAEIHKASGGKSLGNVRAMHGNVAAGKLTQMVFNDVAKQIEVCAKIVDDAEWNKVEEGVYTGFSHGGEYVKRWKDEKDATKTRYTAKPAELSIVDNPCLAAATFEMIRADGTTGMVKFKNAAEPDKPKAKAEQVWKATDGQTFAKKTEWEAHQLELEQAEAAAKAAEPGNKVLDALDALGKAIDGKVTPDPEKDEKEALEKKAKADAAKTKRGEIIAGIKKGFAEAYDCKTALEALCLLESLVCGEEWEAMLGNGEEGQIVDLKEAISRLKTFIAAEIMEGTEMEMSVAIEVVKATLPDNDERTAVIKALEEKAKARPVTKAGARHSAADKGHLAKSLGYLEDAKDHHEDAAKAHGKMTEAHDNIEKCYGKMQDCMKAIPWGDLSKIGDDSKPELVTFKKAAEEGQKGMKSHLDEAEDHLSKAMKQHGKIGKGHTGMAKAHEGIGESLGLVGAQAADPHVVEPEHRKAVEDEMKKLSDSVADLKKMNEELLAKNTAVATENTELNKTLNEVNNKIPALLDRVQKLENTPMPAKGALYDAGAGGVVKKGHEVPVPEKEPVEAQPPVRGLSPEGARRMLGI